MPTYHIDIRLNNIAVDADNPKQAIRLGVDMVPENLEPAIIDINATLAPASKAQQSEKKAEEQQ